MNMIISIFASPGEVFASLKEKPRFLWALLLIMAGAALVQFIYFNGVDIQWFFEQQLAANPNTTQQQAEDTVQFISNLPQAGIAVFFALIAAAFTVGAILIQALYFKVISGITKDGLRYKQYFALMCWATMPGLLSSLAQFVRLLTSDVSLMPATEINPLSFWGLLNLEPIGAGTFDQIVMNTDPTTIWSIGLAVLGYKILSGKDWATAAMIALIPVIVLYAFAFTF